MTAQIGVGGMGEVYQATDTTLTRQVAIKVLPESELADLERAPRRAIIVVQNWFEELRRLMPVN